LPLKCPACCAQVADIRYRYTDDNRHRADESLFYRCQECSFIFARPVLIPELNNRQMDGVENAEMFNSKLMKWLYTKLFLKREISTLRELARGKSECRLLDIGCGTGWTTKVFKDYGFTVTGVEPSAVRAEIARQRYGIEIINDYLENLSGTAVGYDVIVLRHIIEHLAEPDAIMQKVHDLLADDGIVVVIVPNINCLGRYIFETNWAWVLPWHCNFFTPKSIMVFMKRLGFMVESQYQTPSPLYFPDSLLRVISSQSLTKLAGKNKGLLRLALAPVAIVGSILDMGDNLNIFARKEDFES